jgi:tetratricopeptide (TPR) repeat protein
MRESRREESIAAADRALSIAELRNREEIVAEALVNKASTLAQVGRRRESSALHAAALQLAIDTGNRWLELRARNNYASVLSDDDPARATDMFREACEVARDIGDRQMYNWLLGNVASGARSSGDGWDEVLQELDESLARATLPFDRVRLGIFVSLLRGERGESVDGLVDEMIDITRGRPEIDMRFPAAMVQSHRALSYGDADSAYRFALEAIRMDAQNPEIAAWEAFRAAVLHGDPDRIREAAGFVRALPASGAMSIALLRHAEAAVMGLDGRQPEAAAQHAAAHAAVAGMGQHFDAAIMATEANVLLPGRPELRPMAEQARETLTRTGARVWLARLDGVLAAAPPAPAGDAPSTTTAHAVAE